ncbi:MAG: hypothetical protein RIQ89_1779 [Bacteroidota bacterium]|jgi:TolB protein
MKYLLLCCFAAFMLGHTPLPLASSQDANDSLRYEGEVHLKNITQLTFGGDNAEAYYSFDSKKLVFQATNPAWGDACDQIYTATIDQFKPVKISTGDGRTTCSYFLPDGQHVLYASTHLGDKQCPPKPAPRSDHKYVWPLYPTFDIFTCDLNGNVVGQLTNNPGYDAEATVSPKGDKIVFTSTRSGDLELYTMDLDGKNVKQITNELGYDGGAFFSPDGKQLVFRASRPKTEEEIKTYRDLLKQDLVMPSNMEIYTCNVDGSDLKKITNLGHANWAPFFSPDQQKIIFSSNHKSGGYQFNLYAIDIDGSNLEQITFDKTFDAFPVFSPDGKKLVWSSNRNNKGTRDTNLFIADWVD